MARFDVYAQAGAESYLLDVQANLLGTLNTRVVVPLLPRAQAPLPAARLNPGFEIQGQPLVMVTQFMAAVPVSVLKAPVATLDAERDAILAAIDFLHQGW